MGGIGEASEEIKWLHALLEYAAMHGDEAKTACIRAHLLLSPSARNELCFCKAMQRGRSRDKKVSFE